MKEYEKNGIIILEEECPICRNITIIKYKNDKEIFRKDGCNH